MAIINGTPGDDTITGTDDNDTVHLFAGRDTASGGDGADRIHGDSGDDILDGGDGNDRLLGGGGTDVLAGGQGRNTLDGGDGVDFADYGAKPGILVDLAAGFARPFDGRPNARGALPSVPRSRTAG